MPQQPDTAELAARERRLKADFDDARATYQRAKANLDRITDELRDLRMQRAAAELNLKA